MRQMVIPMGALCLLGVGLAATLSAPAARDNRPCDQIAAACRGAGFAPGSARAGAGLQVDCIEPIMQGTAQRPQASKLLPDVDPQLVAACKARNPKYGQRNAPAQAVEQPLPASPPAAAAQSTPPPSSGTKRPNIVFILTDDLSLNLVQYMPHVVKMQNDGVTFANYFVTDSLCCPSRSSIFTGRFPHDTA